MGTYGPNAGATFTSDATLGVVAWTNPTNAAVQDATYATAVLLLSQISNYLKVTGFGFAIPADATISGVTVNIRRSGNTLNATQDDSVKLVQGGTIAGNEKASGSLWATSDATATYGSSTDLWGLTLVPADVNLSTFGVGIAALAALAGTAQIDYVSVTVAFLGSNRLAGQVRQMSCGSGMSRSDLN